MRTVSASWACLRKSLHRRAGRMPGSPRTTHLSIMSASHSDGPKFWHRIAGAWGGGTPVWAKRAAAILGTTGNMLRRVTVMGTTGIAASPSSTQHRDELCQAPEVVDPVLGNDDRLVVRVDRRQR